MPGLFSRMDEFFRGKQLPYNPDRARHHLEIANGYFEKYFASKVVRDKKNFLRFAAQHIEKARAYDARAIFSHIRPDDKTEEHVTVDRMAAIALFYEAQLAIQERRNRHAAHCMERALEYHPQDPQYLNLLAEAYIRQNRRGKALKVLRSNIIPDQRTHELMDRLEAEPHLGSFLKPRTFAYLIAAFFLLWAYVEWNGVLVVTAIVTWMVTLNITGKIDQRHRMNKERGEHDL